jgi:hypothetical protein
MPAPQITEHTRSNADIVQIHAIAILRDLRPRPAQEIRCDIWRQYFTRTGGVFWKHFGQAEHNFYDPLRDFGMRLWDKTDILLSQNQFTRARDAQRVCLIVKNDVGECPALGQLERVI